LTLKILILRFSSIGDIVLSTSPLATLRSHFTSARIDFVTLNTMAPLLEGHPAIDRLIVVEQSARAAELTAVGRFFNQAGYDLVLDLHNTLRAVLIRRELRNTMVKVLHKPRWQRFKLIQFHVNHFPPGFSQRWLFHRPLENLVPPAADFPPPQLVVSPGEQEEMYQRLKRQGLAGDYVVLIPGAAWPQKRWPVAHYRQLSRWLIDDLGLQIVVLGGSRDHICEAVAEGISGMINLQGKTELRESLACIAQARLCIGSDTGFVHAAEALNVPAVMILGPTTVETGAGTSLPSSTTIQNHDLWCRPCSQNGRRPCYRGEPLCLTQIKTETVQTAVRKYLA
jgi:lipopolysaccharide heptosyltransferase II